MNLLMTLDRNYVPQLNVMLFSALHSDSAAHFDVYLLHDEGLSEEDVAGTRVLLGQRGELHLIRVNEDGLADAPTSDRYPKAIYYRIFAAKYLPDTLERVLYLDPDIVVRQSLRELYEMFQHDYMQTLPDMNRYGEYFATNQEYIRKYRFANAFHPFHGFSMMSCGHIAEMHTSAIYIVGAREPGIARGMGLKTRATFEEALEDAKRKFVGPNPNILALPKTFTTAAVHLCMKDPAQNSHSRDGIVHPCGG